MAANAERCNAMTDEELLAMFNKGECPYEPEHMAGAPIGMFHCPVCGIMVLAGLPHAPIKWSGDLQTGYADFVIDDDIPT